MDEVSGEPRREDGTDGAGGAPDAEGGVAAEGSVPVMEPEFVSGSVAPAPAPYRPMARRRLALLTAAAVVLGVLAGAGAGYKVQQDRKPTPLPRLVGAAPTQPAAPGPVPPTPKKADDANAVYEGNLLKLLLPTPKGAKQEYRRWVSQAERADVYDDAAGAFTELSKDGFRRSAAARWASGKKGSIKTEVQLTQFRDEVETDTTTYANYFEYADESHQGYSTPIDGTLSGEVMPSAVPYTDEGFDVYVGMGYARVGNIFVEVYVTDLHPVSRAQLTSVVKKQLERL